MLCLEVQMESNIDKLIQIRNMAIKAKSPLQFGLTSLLLRLEYGDLEEKLSNAHEEEKVL